jgi:hypothetical protein
MFLNCARLITHLDFPKSYNSCASKLLKVFGEKIEYYKRKNGIVQFAKSLKLYLNIKEIANRFFIGMVIFNFKT